MVEWYSAYFQDAFVRFYCWLLGCFFMKGTGTVLTY